MIVAFLETYYSYVGAYTGLGCYDGLLTTTAGLISCVKMSRIISMGFDFFGFGFLTFL
jgi:hypothetical protein